MFRIRLLLVVMLLFGALGIAGTTSTPADAQAPCLYTVVTGDTLFKIALRYGLRTNDLAIANNIANVNLIYVGQQLVIPTAACGGIPAPLATQPQTAQPTATPPVIPSESQVYIVRTGDTLARIAHTFRVPMQVLMQLNGITNPSLIFVGQKLVITGALPATPVDPSQPGVPTATPAPQVSLPPNCGPGFHQENCWPTFGGNWDRLSIEQEPIIFRWENCTPERVSGSVACSKTGLGYFQIPPPPTPIPAPSATPATTF